MRENLNIGSYYKDFGLFNIRQAMYEDCSQIIDIWIKGMKFNNISIFSDDYVDYFVKKISMQENPFLTWIIEKDNTVFGWLSLSPVMSNPYFRETKAELSIFMKPNLRFKGISDYFLQFAVNYAKKQEINHLIGFVSQSNKAVQNLVYRNNFEKVGTLPSKNSDNVSILCIAIVL